MKYFSVSILNSPLDKFTYKSIKDIKIGTIVEIDFRNRTLRGVVLDNNIVCENQDFNILEIKNTEQFFYSTKQIELAKFISTYYMSSIGEALSIMTAFTNVNTDTKLIDDNFNIEVKLSQKQKNAVDFLSLESVSLLFGDTGSGKTEIYMKLFEQMIKKKKRSIFLMPEISLTPQMGDRLKKYFGDKVVIWHSKLSPLQKKSAFSNIENETAYIVAGPRSALFLPLKNLGLIVVDEEHDDSYKSSSKPRYNARDIAIYMGKLYGAKVVLGSATPSLGSYVKFKNFRLKGSHFETKRKFIYEKSPDNLSPLILEKLTETLKNNEQSIVFLPTRANFKYLVCSDCGTTYKCIFCSTGMSIHHKSNALKCHYCNYTQAIPQSCSKCNSVNLHSLRLGTAEVAKNISKELKLANVELFDRDTITTATKLKKALKKFNEKDIDILVGTQMLSKGHDYHGVTLAVILGIDNLLNMGDYRSREKALSALLQVAGRSGRSKDSLVLVQSFNEDFFSYYLDDYELFLKDEIKFREELYPPFKKLCRIVFAHKNGLKSMEEMRKMESSLKNNPDIEIVGSGKCLIEKVSNKYRFEILLRSQKSVDIIKSIKVSRVKLAEIDMDPMDFS